MIEKRQLQTTLTGKVFFLTIVAFFLSTLTTSLGGVIDNFVVGHTMTSAEVGSISLTSPVWFFTALLYNTLSSGCRPVCANEFSKGNKERACRVYSATLAAGLGLTFILVLLTLIFRDPVTRLLGAKPGMDVYEPCKAYLTGIVIGFPAVALICILSVGISLEGGRRWTVWSAIVVTVSNIVMDLLTAHFLKGNIFCMGLTTSLSYYAGAAVLAVFYIKKRNELMLKPVLRGLSFRTMGGVVYRGMPHGVSRLTTSWRSAYLNHLFAASVTAVGLAAYNVQVQINYLTNALFMGTAQALSLLVCVYYAEENRAGIRRTVLIALAFDMFFGLAIMLLLQNENVRALITTFYLGSNTESFMAADVALTFFALGLPGQVVAILFANYLQSTGRPVWSAAVYVLSDMVLLIAFVSAGQARLPGNIEETITIGAAFRDVSFAQLFMLIVIPVIIILINLGIRGRRSAWDMFLMLPGDFGVPKEQELTAMPKNKEEVTRFSEEIYDFCIRQNLGRKAAYITALAAEEMGTIVIDKGFSDGKRHMLEMRLVRKNNALILRMRDDCALYDPIKQIAEIPDNEDLTASIGIRMIMKLASDVSYTSSLKLNNLMIRVDLPESAAA